MAKFFLSLGALLSMFGLGVFAVAVVNALFFWFTEVATWHWRNGNPWPMVVPAAMLCFLCGAILVSAFADDEVSK
jgi:hypothetical protein